jgi:IclR family transcriptional regulator, acetate operon repressor
MNPVSRPPKGHRPLGGGVISKALDVLDMLRNLPGGATLTEISVAVKFPKATVFRMMRTLELRAYVERSKDLKYRLSSKFYHPSSPEGFTKRSIDVSHPVMSRLVEQFQETVNLGVLDGGEVVVVHAIESPRSIRMSSKIGNRRHAHSTGLGKVLLAWRDPKEVERIVRVKGLPRLTPKTITTLEELDRELARVRKKGYAEDREENELQVKCVAVPVRNAQGDLLAGLSVSGPASRMDAQKIKAILASMRPAVEELGRLL